MSELSFIPESGLPYAGPAFRLSALQKNILIVMAALAERGARQVATLELEQLLAKGADRPVYGGNLRSACHKLAAAGMLATLRATNLQLAVELTPAGERRAAPLLAAERDARAEAEKRDTVIPLPHRADPAEPQPVCLELDGESYEACAARLVVPYGEEPYLLLLCGDAEPLRLKGDAVVTGRRYQACFDAGLPVSVQINEWRA